MSRFDAMDAPRRADRLRLGWGPATGGGLWGTIYSGCAAPLVSTPKPVADEAAVRAWAETTEIPPACGHSTPGPPPPSSAICLARAIGPSWRGRWRGRGRAPAQVLELDGPAAHQEDAHG